MIPQVYNKYGFLTKTPIQPPFNTHIIPHLLPAKVHHPAVAQQRGEAPVAGRLDLTPRVSVDFQDGISVGYEWEYGGFQKWGYPSWLV